MQFSVETHAMVRVESVRLAEDWVVIPTLRMCYDEYISIYPTSKGEFAPEWHRIPLILLGSDRVKLDKPFPKPFPKVGVSFTWY